MKVLILEDEKPAAQRLEKLLISYDIKIEILDKISSVKKAIEWFNTHVTPDLVFMDIQLSDGISFEIFEYVDIKCPIVFTTAYDEYALKAFRVNSIDYLLKPIDEEGIEQAFSKLKKLGLGKPKDPGDFLDQVSQAMKMLQSKYKNRFLVKVGERIHAIPVNEILYFYSKEKACFCHTTSNKNYLLDYSLEQLEAMVDPQEFFRVNRQFLICFQAVKDIISYSSSRLKLMLEGSSEDVIVSRDRVGDFKNWLDR